ncbi:outer membrane beta-barrel family protein [Croceivirga sp. JEA036]|uniref:outer membrane beta-barrel family protein n=1 Tax=Croceivirga sp. JEA036 TaxID=2721162 RepID=UPI001438C523|nr:outer membrane beta-barrel family protein [Croceivirga sp. JEA036]NJB37025.1 TonB-dependent receptor [Croceivirga sp. JEA036]
MLNLRYALLLGLFLSTKVLLSQEYKLHGEIINAQAEQVPFANVLMYKAKDTSYIGGVSADENGKFLFQAVKSDSILVRASYVGLYSEYIFHFLNKDYNLGAIILQSDTNELEEVVVTQKRPTVNRLADRLVFNVENTVVSSGDSWSILRNTPGVIENQGNLLVKGKKASIYINNRKVHLSENELQDLLEGYSGVNIKAVEVMATPPSNYDANSGAIINIVTSKGLVAGYKGSVNGSYTQAVFPKYSLGTSHYYQTEKVNVFANYNFSPKKEIFRSGTGVNYKDENNETYSSWFSNSDVITKSRVHNLNTSLDYTIDENNKLNFTSNVVIDPNKKNNRLLDAFIFNRNKTLDSTFNSLREVDTDRLNIALDGTYERNFTKLGSKLTLNAHITSFNHSQTQNLGSNYFSPSGNLTRSFSFTTEEEQDITIFTSQLDYEQPIGSGSIETGIKFAGINSDNLVDYYNFQGEDQNVTAALSDNFEYDEKVYAAYLTYINSWDKFSTKIGVRGEYTDAVGNSLSLGQQNNQNFFELFPSVFLTYAPNENNSFSIDYNRGVTRPKYQDLNPFRLFINENDFSEGNPNLVPHFTNNFNFNYTINGEYFIDFYYRDNGAYISPLEFQDNELRIKKSINQNVLESTSYGLDFTVSKSLLSSWYFYGYASFFYEDETFLAIESGNVPYKNKVDGVYLYLGNYLTLSKDGSFTGEISLTHLSEFIFGSYVQSATTNLNIGFRKNLWKNRASISVQIEDVLKKANPRMTSKYLNQDNYYYSREETRFLRLGFTYNFGNYRLSNNERAINKNERDRLKD